MVPGSSTNIVCRFNGVFLCTFFIHLLLLKDNSLGIAYASARVYLQIQINGQVSFFVKWTNLNLDHKQQWRCEKKRILLLKLIYLWKRSKVLIIHHYC